MVVFDTGGSARRGFALRFPMTIAAIRTQVAELIHASVLPSSPEWSRHERFILSRLAIGALGLGLAPAYLAWRGTLGAVETGLLVAVSLPLLAVVLLSRTARFGLAHGVSAAAMSLAVCILAGVTGGVASPFLFALALVPAEAMLLGSCAAIGRAMAIALAGLAAVVALDGVGPGNAEAAWSAGTGLVLAALAIAYTGGLGFWILRGRDSQARAHQATAARARLLLDTVGDLVTWHDAGGSVVNANAAALNLAGAEPKELLGRGLLERVHIADRPLFLTALSEAAHGKGQASATFRTLFLPKAGADAPRAPVSLWLEMQAHRIENGAAGDGVVVVSVMRDVTARLALEAEQARTHAEAVKASDIKGQFLATVSHELRTPLNAIIGFSEILTGPQDFLTAEKRLDYARIIHESGHHLLDVVNTLLDISKIESGAMTIEREPLDMAAMARECCSLIALRAETGSVALEQVLGPELPAVMGDRRALKQVLINLLSNAVKFTPAGGRVVLAVVRDGDVIDLSIADTGIGIAASDLPRLGEPFFQARSSYNRTHEGTGLGLSVVRGLVGLHGGKLTIESAPGTGTRVCVRLPVAGAASNAQPVPITTYARAPRRAFEAKEPIRLTA